MDVVRRGYVPRDAIEFGSEQMGKMELAAQEIYYLLNRGYDGKSASVFVGNHYLLSERQRLALVRSLAPEKKLENRREKEIPRHALAGSIFIDGFNTIITLEVALSHSLLVQGMDGAIRDLAGLRGTYRIIDKTVEAVERMLEGVRAGGAGEAVVYLDRPVSNSGRLKQLIEEKGRKLGFPVQAEIINDVDRQLYRKGQVVTSDGIILDHCGGWYNLNRYLAAGIPGVWIYKIGGFI